MKISRWCSAARIFMVVSLFLLISAGIAWGKTELPKETILPLKLAQQAANTAIVKCEEGGYG